MRILAVLAAVLMVSACGGLGSSNSDKEVKGEITFERGTPEGINVGEKGGMGAGIDSDGNLVVVTFGSSSNPLRVTEATLEGSEIDLEIENEENKPSTMDFVPTTSVVSFPDGLAKGKEFRVELDDFGTVVVGPERGVITWVLTD